MKLAVVLKMTHQIVDYVINGRNSQCLLFFSSLPLEGDAICDCKKNQNNVCFFFSAQREQNKSEVKMQSFSPQIPLEKKQKKLQVCLREQGGCSYCDKKEHSR